MTEFEMEQLVERIAVRLEQRLAIRFGQASVYDPVFSVQQAMDYIGAKTGSAFYRWTGLRGVNRCGTGKYRKSALDKALDVSNIVIAARRGMLRRKKRVV